MDIFDCGRHGYLINNDDDTVSKVMKSNPGLSEYCILRHLNHPCVIKPLDLTMKRLKNYDTDTEKYTNDESDYVIMKMKKYTHTLSDISLTGAKDLCAIIYCIASALEHIHAKNIIHRDIKEDNILIYLDPELSVVKEVVLADFGNAIKLLDIDVELHDDIFSNKYAAPETKTSDYGTLADIWSLGALLEFQMEYLENPIKKDRKFLNKLILLCKAPVQNRITATEVMSLIFEHLNAQNDTETLDDIKMFQTPENNSTETKEMEIDTFNQTVKLSTESQQLINELIEEYDVEDIEDEFKFLVSLTDKTEPSKNLIKIQCVLKFIDYTLLDNSIVYFEDDSEYALIKENYSKVMFNILKKINFNLFEYICQK